MSRITDVLRKLYNDKEVNTSDKKDKKKLNESYVHMTDENRFNPLVTGESLKVGDVVYSDKDERTKWIVKDLSRIYPYTIRVTFQDEDDQLFEQDIGTRSLWEVAVEGDRELEVDDDIDIEWHPIDQFFEEAVGDDTSKKLFTEYKVYVGDRLYEISHTAKRKDEIVPILKDMYPDSEVKAVPYKHYVSGYERKRLERLIAQQLEEDCKGEKQEDDVVEEDTNDSAENKYRYIKMSDNALKFVGNVIGQLSDGYWENSPAMEKYWMFADATKDGLRIAKEYRTWPYGYNYRSTPRFNGFVNKSDDEIKKWFAQKIKQLVKIEQQDNPSEKLEWKRDNQTPLDYMDGTVAEAYKAYDELMGRGVREGLNSPYTSILKAYEQIGKDQNRQDVVDLAKRYIDEAEKDSEINEDISTSDKWLKFVNSLSKTEKNALVNYHKSLPKMPKSWEEDEPEDEKWINSIVNPHMDDIINQYKVRLNHAQ